MYNIDLEIKNSTDELLQLLSSLSEGQLNQVPFEGSWTAGQVGDHLLKSYDAVRMLNGRTAPTQRPADEKVQEIKELFLNFEVKLQSPEFIIPSGEMMNKERLLKDLRERIDGVIGFSRQDDLSETCLGFEFPGSGAITKLEWAHFFNCHTLRHYHQLKNIVDKISTKSPVSG